jgi:superfamily II DNA/RNA helicase
VLLIKQELEVGMQKTGPMRGATSMLSRAPLWSSFIMAWKPRFSERVERFASRAAAYIQQPNITPENDFYSSRYTSFASLGLDTRVTMALENAGFDRVADVQALAIPSILEGRDVVLAAETGSGKTLAYLAPIANRLLSVRDQDSDRLEQGIGAIVLCPNMALCQQVASVAQECFS